MLKCCWRDAFLVVIWLMLLPAVHSLRPRYSGKDVLVQNSVSALLQASLTPNCTTLFITEDSSSSKPILQVLLDNSKHPIAFLEVQPFKKSNMTVVEITSIVQQALKIKKTSSCIIILLVSDDIDFLTNIIKISSDNGLFSHPSRLLLFTRRTPTSLQTVQEQLSIINAAVVILSELPTYERCVVYVYLPYSLKKIQVASWTSKYGLSYFYDETLFPDKSKRLKEGGHLTIAAIYYPSHSILKVNTSADSSSIATISGPVKEVLSMLSAAINFTYHIVPFYSYGNLLSNGSWNGMVGAIHRKEADMALGPLAITYERSKVVQYTVSIFDDYLHIQGKRGATEVDPWAFATPFNPEVWAALFSTLALAIIVSSIYAKITFDHVPSKGSAFTYIKILLHQDIDKIALSWWERMIVGGWMMTIMISGESYSGNLMSQLAVRYISQPYQSLRVVLDDPKIKIMWMANTVYDQYLKSSESGILLEVAKSDEYGKITYVNNSMSEYLTSVQTLVAGGTHVSVVPYIAQKVFLTQAFTDEGNCRFYFSKEKYLPFIFAMVVQKNSPLLRTINDGLRGIVEGGLYNYWVEKEVPLAKGCRNPPTKVTVKSSLSASELWGMFTLLFAGYGIGLSVFGLELITPKLGHLF